jgi:hypothetical protein
VRARCVRGVRARCVRGVRARCVRGVRTRRGAALSKSFRPGHLQVLASS